MPGITSVRTIKITINTAAAASHIQRGPLRRNCHTADLAAEAPRGPGGFSTGARSGPVQAGRAGSRWSIGARSLGKSGRPDGLAHAAPGSRYQFERNGYFCVDEKDSCFVFNRIVALRDTWAKQQAGKKG